MKRYYLISCRIVREQPDGSRTSLGVPTFILDPDIQWIRDPAHAESIARKVVNPLALPEVTVHPVVSLIEEPA